MNYLLYCIFLMNSRKGEATKLDDYKYGYQNDLEIYCGGFHEIMEKEFNDISDFYDFILHNVWIEEKFSILAENYMEIEKDIFESYNAIKATNGDNEKQRSICNNLITLCNRRLLNFLCSARMYLDQTAHDLSTIDNQIKSDMQKQFKSETRSLYDSYMGYQIMELFRDISQHQCMPIEKIIAYIPFSSWTSDYMPIIVEFNLGILKNYSTFLSKVKKKFKIAELLDYKTDNLNIVPYIREYFQCLCLLHKKYRTITEKTLTHSINSIETILNNYKIELMNSVAFCKIDQLNNLKDHRLVELSCFIKILKQRENEDFIKNSFFISNRPFVSSIFVKGSNVCTVTSKMNRNINY